MSRHGFRPLIVGNWKMNGLSADLPTIRSIDEIAGDAGGVEVGLALPFTLIPRCAPLMHHAMIGAQTCHAQPRGAFTGEISAAMLADCGMRLVILGHSERRHGQAESNAIVQSKVQAAVEAGLRVILCVGETARERDSGQAVTIVQQQLIESLPPAPLSGAALTIAYEPVWAIGSGLVPTGSAIEEMHRAIRDTLHALGHAPSALPRVLYGGSVTADNAGAILRLNHVDGALVGNASLDARNFATIIREAAGKEQNA